MARKRLSKAEARAKAANRARNQNSVAQSRLDSKKAQARRTFHQEVAADRGAAGYVKGSLRSTLGDLGSYGLGRYTGDVRSELTSRLGDAGNLVAFNRTAHRADMQDALASLADQQATLDAAVATDQRSAYRNIMDRERDAQQKARERAQEKAKREKDFSRDLDKALAEIRNQVQGSRGDSPVAHQVERQNLRRDPSLRRALEDYLVSQQGVGRRVARKAVALYTKRNERGYKPGSIKTVADQVQYLAGAGFSEDYGPTRDKMPWE